MVLLLPRIINEHHYEGACTFWAYRNSVTVSNAPALDIFTLWFSATANEV